MIIINNDNTSPYFNLALEEYILKEFKDDCFMLWRDIPCVVVGKNQNSLSEINIEYVEKNNIPVIRRLSGGGAVFHDLGNLNFTFINNDNENNFNNYKKFTDPIIEVLQKLDVNAELSGRNDLLIDGKKFSGNAQYKYKNRLLHHGTLLFSSNVTNISDALKANPMKFENKSVKSVKSRVTNISDNLKKKLDIIEFKDLIIQHITEEHKEFKLYNLTEDDIKKVNFLMDNKYNTYEWNFGKSPKYNFNNKMKFTCGIIEVNMNIVDGIIKNIKIYGDFFCKYDISNIEKALIDVKHNREGIKKALSNFDIDDYFLSTSLEEILDLFF